MPVTAPLTTAEVFQMLGVARDADPARGPFRRVTTLQDAGPEDISFIARPRMEAEAEGCRAGLLITPVGSNVTHPGAVEVRDVWGAVLTLLEYFHPEPPVRPGIHPTAVVAPSAHVAAGAEIGPLVVIGEDVVIGDGAIVGAQCSIGDGCRIGAHTRLHPRVTVYPGCRIGQRVIIHSGAVIGADGFKYEPARGRLCKIPQVGIVVIEDDVEIGANTTVDRASFTETRIGARTKIDNLVQIGHNVVMGSDCLVVAQVGVAGSAKIGRGVIIAGQAGIRDNVTIGDGVRIGGQSGVGEDLPPKTDWLGSPAMPAREAARLIAIQKRLPELFRKLGPLLNQMTGASEKTK